MSIYKNGKLIAGGRQCMPLLSFMWADHKLNDISWLRADTFSWQSGDVYQLAYQHLVNDYAPMTNDWTVAVEDQVLLPRSTTWRALGYNGSIYVAITSTGYISTSTDGTTWTTPTKNTNLGSNIWNNVFYDNTKFILISSSGYISTSTDGTTWTAAVQNTDLGNNSWQDIAYNGTLYVAVSTSGYISTSTDGTTWTPAVQDSNLGNRIWASLIYANSKFIVISTSGYISTSTDGTTWTTPIQNTNLGNRYWQDIAYNGMSLVAIGSSGYISTSTDGTTWTPAVQNTNLGDHNWHNIVFNGSKFLALSTYCYLSTTNTSTETVAGTTIEFYKAADGHKIVTAVQESNVEAIYASTGVAWYYIIDIPNGRFKLPRTQFGVTGLRDTVGNYVAPGLPNITGKFAYDVWQSASYDSGAFYNDGGNKRRGTDNDSGSSGGRTAFDASRSNAIYGASTTVQAPATQMYLYFYVGQFTQTAIENTAGLNAELFNGKVDEGHQVIEFQAPTSQNNYTWYRKYADGWVEQGQYRREITKSQANIVTLPVPMADTSFGGIISCANTTYGTATTLSIDSYSTTQVNLWGYTSASASTIRVSWEVKGMAA